jgi:hypothetical protein
VTNRAPPESPCGHGAALHENAGRYKVPRAWSPWLHYTWQLAVSNGEATNGNGSAKALAFESKVFEVEKKKSETKDREIEKMHAIPKKYNSECACRE